MTIQASNREAFILGGLLTKYLNSERPVSKTYYLKTVHVSYSKIKTANVEFFCYKIKCKAHNVNQTQSFPYCLHPVVNIRSLHKNTTINSCLSTRKLISLQRKHVSNCKDVEVNF